jgi:hypothetical protein
MKKFWSDNYVSSLCLCAAPSANRITHRSARRQSVIALTITRLSAKLANCAAVKAARNGKSQPIRPQFKHILSGGWFMPSFKSRRHAQLI